MRALPWSAIWMADSRSYTAPSGLGPEGRNTEARVLEHRLEGLAQTLGWTIVHRNQDLYLDESRQARGIDRLLAIPNPRTELNEGWLMEGKLHASSETYIPSTHEEIETLREKT